MEIKKFMLIERLKDSIICIVIILFTWKESSCDLMSVCFVGQIQKSAEPIVDVNFKELMSLNFQRQIF